MEHTDNSKDEKGIYISKMEEEKLGVAVQDVGSSRTTSYWDTVASRLNTQSQTE